MAPPASPTVRTGAPFGRSARIAALTVVFPARRGTAMTRNDRRARAASRSVDAIGRGRAEIADLRQGRGAAAPAWLTQYANAICSHDAEYVETHTDAALGMTLDEVTTQFDTMHARGQDCTAVRYL